MIRWICILFISLVMQAQELRIQVLCTTDMHAAVMPEDAYTLQPAAKGWAQMATLIRAHKAKNPNTLLVDCGDTLQGEPLAYLSARLHPELPDPSMAIMNALGYHAMTVGNHDFDWGQAVARKAEEQATFPWLAANSVLATTGKPAFTPYVVVEYGGAKVGVLGLTTSGMARIADPTAIAGLRFLDAVESARTWVPVLREKEKVDVVVVALHGGLGTAESGLFDDNQALALVERVPGIDLVFGGHTHEAIATRHKGVWILQAQAHGRALAVADLVLKKEKQQWKLLESHGRLVHPTLETVSDPQVLEITAPLRKIAEEYLNTFATNLAVDLDGRWSRMEDSTIVQLLHAVQRKAVGAQLSATFSPSTRYFVPKGPTSIRQFWALMPYENKVARISITGIQVKLWLEHAARYFNFGHLPELVNRAIPGYDFDMIDGVTYALDLTKPLGKRVVDLKFKGQAVKENQAFTMAITSYRLSGGGGYLSAINFKGQPELVNPVSLRNLLFEYVLSQPSLNVPLAESWRTIPALDRERVLVQMK
ncbi:MAG: bifunctional UDP-sugar hydrolase/5'-nucleotidase [Holophaga sp.]|nr:bifunctional UDP-sugar hydrolase/5'-nucleotidase [Holophaga sp.]